MSIKQLIHENIQSVGDYGATDEEVAIGLGIKASTACARRLDLEREGKVRDSGKRRFTTTGRSPREAIVWVACDLPIAQPRVAPKLPLWACRVFSVESEGRTVCGYMIVAAENEENAFSIAFARARREGFIPDARATGFRQVGSATIPGGPGVVHLVTE